MYVVRVVPVTRGAFAEELTYFSRTSLPPGCVIEVPLQRRTISAIVLSCASAREEKAGIRSADFALRRIDASAGARVLTPAMLEALSQAAEYYVTTPGTVLFHTLPALVRNEGALPEPVLATPDVEEHTPHTFTPQLLMADERTRIEEYQKIIRATFAQGRSVILLTPTIHDAELLARSLRKGIEGYRYLLHSSRSKKQILDAWNQASTERHPVLLIMTPGFLALPRADVGAIIVDREATRSYKQLTQPFIDFRLCAEWLARASSAFLVLADEPVRVSTMQRFEDGSLETLREIPTRITRTPPTHILDMRAPADTSREARTPFRVFSDELLRELTRTHEVGERTFLFVARRGIAPVTVCGDCGERVSCLSCGAPVVLHHGAIENVFVCHACGALRSASERCSHCTSWKLVTLGIGIQLVERELARVLPKVPRLIFDREHISTHRKAERLAGEFAATPGAVLLGTEMALTYLPRVSFSAIVSLDSLLSVPEWNMYERIFSIVARTQERTDRGVLIQTRKPDDDILTLAKRGSLGDFYRSELADRARYQYPPHATFIKVTTEGASEATRRTMEELGSALAPWGFAEMPQTRARAGGSTLRQGFMKLTKGFEGSPRRRRGDPLPRKRPEWPIPEVVAILRSFGSTIRVEVDPDKIL